MPSGGQLVIEQFLRAGVKRLFCVPGESYLPVLDAVYDEADIALVSCRHESGAALMAVASAQLDNHPAVVFVTRGPGATNASIAVHVAQQASVPLLLCVGQVSTAKLGREAFQEVDFGTFFAPLTKRVEQLECASQIPRAISQALELCAAGRPGPVVLVFPEDVLKQAVVTTAPVPRARRLAAIELALVNRIATRLDAARRPVIIAGSGDWDDADCERLVDYADRRDIPVFTAFRRNDIFPNHHRCYAGELGLHSPESVWARGEEADVVLVMGARLDEPTTRAYQLLASERAGRYVIHVHADHSAITHHIAPDLELSAAPRELLTALSTRAIDTSCREPDWRKTLHDEYLAGVQTPRIGTDSMLGEVMRVINATVAADTIVTIDAGNFTRWPQRYRQYARPGRLLAPINGAMGYGVPAAVAASLRYPDRTVICCVGDGGMLMTGMELATAMKYGATPIVIVFNNHRYGTIATHQERTYPGRRIGADLHNPDFAAFAQSFGAYGVRVSTGEEFAMALQNAMSVDTIAVIDLALP